MPSSKSSKVVLRREDHTVSRNDIDPDALKVMHRLNRNGYEAYLVGGGVRDLLLGKHPKDFDISTDAHPGQIKELFRNSVLIGRRFRLVHIMFRGKVIEVSTFRRNADPVPKGEEGEKGLYRHRDNTFGTPEEDAERRDFTVNGLFYDVRDFTVIDHVKGLVDIDKRVIRAIGDPNIRFQEDPVRMLRAVRFAARLGFDIERKTYRAIVKQYRELEKSSNARLLEEIYKLFAFGAAEPAFRLLHKTKLLDVLFPELSEYLGTGRRAAASPLWKYLATLDAGLDTCQARTPPLLLAALFYAPFRDHLDEVAGAGRKVMHEDVARAVLQPAAERYHMPKNVFYPILHMFADQRRFEPQAGHRFSRSRLVARDWFLEALAIREMDLRVHGQDLAPLDEWRKHHREHQTAHPQEERDERRAPRRRRRRRPRGRRPSQNDSRNKTTEQAT